MKRGVKKERQGKKEGKSERKRNVEKLGIEKKRVKYLRMKKKNYSLQYVAIISQNIEKAYIYIEIKNV